MPKRNYEVSYTIRYHVIVAANSEADAKQRADNVDWTDWLDDGRSEYEVEEVCEEPNDY